MHRTAVGGGVIRATASAEYAITSSDGMQKTKPRLALMHNDRRYHKLLERSKHELFTEKHTNSPAVYTSCMIIREKYAGRSGKKTVFYDLTGKRTHAIII